MRGGWYIRLYVMLHVCDKKHMKLMMIIPYEIIILLNNFVSVGKPHHVQSEQIYEHLLATYSRYIVWGIECSGLF